MEQPMQNIDTKSLFAPKKGKEATKGQKRIHEDNRDTIKFYSIMAGASIAMKLIVNPSNLFLIVFAILVQSFGVGGMYYIANTGVDLNLKAGFADYLKDLTITTSICTTLSLLSNKFWILWLWLPAFFVYKIWMSIIAPWIFAPAPEELAPEVADKKRRKMDRKMARAGYR